MEHQIDHRLDMRGTLTPITLLKATQALREMMDGETMEVLVGDEDTREDLLKVLPSTFCRLMEIKEEPSFHRIRIRKLG